MVSFKLDQVLVFENFHQFFSVNFYSIDNSNVNQSFHKLQKVFMSLWVSHEGSTPG